MIMAVTASVIISALSGVPDAGWMAGVARVDITPEEPMWLAGYAGRDHASEGAIHPLWFKALALQDAADRRAVLLTSDILGFPKGLSDRIRDRLRETLGLERAQIILSASHTHSSPVIDGSLVCMYAMDDEERAKVKRHAAVLEGQAVAVVEEAFRVLQPARLASANGVTRFAVNRRNNPAAQILSTHDFKGPVDHAVPVLRVSTENGSPLAVVFGYACHCTTLNGYQWSGDYAGFAQIAVEAAWPGCTAMFFAGCGADQNPLPRRTVALAKQYGEELAAAVERVLTDPMQTLEATLATACKEQELLLNAPPSREELAAIAEAGPPYKTGCAEEMIAELDAGGSLRTSYPYPVVAWRLGAQNLIALGGEVVVDYAIFIKQMLGNDTFVMGYANDVMSYIPSERVLKEGGYEVDVSQLIYGMPAKWQEGIEAHVLDAVRDAAKEAGVKVKDEG